MIPTITDTSTNQDIDAIITTSTLGSIIKFSPYEDGRARLKLYIAQKVLASRSYTFVVDDIRPGNNLYSLYGTEHTMVTAITA